MRMLYARYNEQVNAIDIVNYEMNYILRLRCDEWEKAYTQPCAHKDT